MKERIVMKSKVTTDVGEFAVFCTTANSGVVTTGVLNTFWFPDKIVEPGDLVILYSKGGTQSEKRLHSGRTAHFFYWGAGPAIWNQDGVAPVLLHIDQWNAYLPDEE